ncbi:MAG: YkgJ family cysteine cluster protein [Myxococcales bacterium]|jgi:Fe-S-cluster containining protein
MAAGRESKGTQGTQDRGKRAQRKRARTGAPGGTNGAARQTRGIELPVVSDRDGGAREPVHCLSCGLCCTYIAVEIDGPDSVSSAAEILWHLYHEGVSIYCEDDEWMVQIETRCQHLQDDLKCAIYEHRPTICREYDEVGCEVNAEDVGQLFFTPAEFLDWLKTHHKRVHTLLSKKYVPGEEHLQGSIGRRRRVVPFKRRFGQLRAMGER